MSCGYLRTEIELRFSPSSSWEGQFSSADRGPAGKAMSRRKQSKPRQIKRSIGDLEGGEDNPPDDVSLSGEEGGASDPEDSAECDSSSPPPFTPLYHEEPRTQDSRGDPVDEDEDEEERGPARGATQDGPEEEDGEEEEEEEEEEERQHWRGPVADVDLLEGDVTRVMARRDLLPDTTWGPYPGVVQPEDTGDVQVTESSRLSLVCEDADCWLSRIPLTSDTTDANCTIYSQGNQLFCKVTHEVSEGDCLLAELSLSFLDPLSSPLSLTTHNALVKEEPTYQAALRPDIQLLPQQAGMAAILATAVVNKDIFPCKDCGIWYRSERNLQAHLMYYCASRQKQPSNPASSQSPPQDKAKEAYPNERICPFPQCNKSCPSASSLEIHMRTHSGERPFICLVCLSAFTTKANCERHLKVHTDGLNGVCHGCGFVSTTRDILYSHLVTCHMVCQPGSRSEVYSPGPGLPKLPLATGLSPGDSGVVLKCQVCGHNADSPAQLQQHVRTHLEVRLPAERSPAPRQATPPSADHLQAREPAARATRPDSATPPPENPAGLRIKEEPFSEGEELPEEAGMKAEEAGGGGEGEEEEERMEEDGEARDEKSQELKAASSQISASPRSPSSSAAAVKAEPASPTPGSSPAHPGGGGGAVFLPQYLFSPEAAILPQASEILAKMSEMVHSRLKQGQAIPPALPPFYPAGAASSATPAGAAPPTPAHKGATCFECDITFNNINNFYVHKRLYCSSRHQQADASSAPAPPPSGSGRDDGPAATAASSSSGGHGSSASPQGAAGRAASASPSDSAPLGTPGSESSSGGAGPEVKTEAPVAAPREGVSSSSSEGEGGGGGGGGGRAASEGSQSPGAESAAEDDPSRTFCQACNIRFSRHDNYTVHKRFYCASRHDPSNQRANHPAKAAGPAPGAAAFMPQPLRTRKRKKMYEIHMARTEALAQAAAAVAASSPAPSALGLAVKQEGRVLEPPAAAARALSSRSSSPEGDGPIDLSKRPRLRGSARGGGGAGAGGVGLLPALPLSDYHKCTACSISFNSIENYLAHKTYYCPATTRQPHALEQLSRLNRPVVSTPPLLLHAQNHNRVLDRQPPDAAVLSLSQPGSEASSPGGGARGGGGGGPSSPQQAGGVCPYCPPGRALTCDLVEHLRSAHSLILPPPPPHPHPEAGPSPALSPRDAAATPPKPGLNPRRDSVNGRGSGGREAASPSSSPLANGSPVGPHHHAGGGGGSPAPAPPLAASPPRALTVSPVAEAQREVGVSLVPDKAALAPPHHHHALPALPGSKPAVPPPLQNGNTRFCRLCNIKFSSLSTFIAHKKYYCSSHSAEHVK